MMVTKSSELEENYSSRKQKARPAKSIYSPAEKSPFLTENCRQWTIQRLIKSGALQAKLTVSEPGDIYEQEADRVAGQVMRMPYPVLQRKCAGDRE